MALANYIGTGTYSIIEKLVFSTKDKHVGFTLKVYSDDAKTALLATKVYDHVMDRDIKVLLGLDVTEPPSAPAVGDKYLIAKTGAVDDWEGYSGHVAEWNPFNHTGEEATWVCTDHGSGVRFYYEPGDSYIEITSMGGNYKSITDNESIKTWDAFFTKEHIFDTPGSNLHSQIYEFLKTQPGFESVIDA